MEENQDLKTAYNYCIFLLSKRDYSKFKIKQKLKLRKHDEETIEKVISELLDKNYLREDEYIRARIKAMIYKGYANNYILQKLRLEELGSSDEDINKLREENNLSSLESIEYLIEKKLRNKEIPSEYEARQKLKNKVLRFLISKGHSFQDSLSSLENYLNR